MAHPALWTVDGPCGRARIFGDMVGVAPQDRWFGRDLRAAVTACRELWCEAGRDDAQDSPALLEAVLAVEPPATP